MASWNLYFDPKTRDVVLNSKGHFVEDNTAGPTVMHQLLCHYGKWWGDPKRLGSKIYDLKFFQARPEVMAPDEARRALGVLVDMGKIRQLEVRAEVPQTGRVVVQSRFQDANTGQLVDTFVKAGG
jgi:phage gp46-like protein